MVKWCVFNGSGASPECRKEGLCAAGNGRDIERCCGKTGIEVHPQALLEAYENTLKRGAPDGVGIALLGTIWKVEEERGIRLL